MGSCLAIYQGLKLARAVGLLSFLLGWLPISANGQFTYFTNNGTITITAYTGPGGEVIIPNTIDGLPVTAIADDAFVLSTNLSGITIPEGVTSLGRFAFGWCYSLTSVAIPDSVTTIGDNAFYYCSALTNAVIGEGVTSIGQDVFFWCFNLQAITVDGSNADYSSTDGVLFNKGQTTLIRYPPAKTGSYTVPTNVITIEGAAFTSGRLDNITLPDTLTTIEANAFTWCESLTNITIPKNVAVIEGPVFSFCPSLSAINVVAQNPAFSSVDGVLFDENLTRIIQCPGAKYGSYTIPNSVTHIGDCAFIYCELLTNVFVPNSVTSIGLAAFQLCTSLTSVTIPNGVTRIGSGTFYYCRSLTSMTIPSTVTNIGDAAFKGCSSLVALYFQGNAPGTGSESFHIATNALIYYLPGTTGWGAFLEDRPTTLWLPLIETSDASFGVHTNQFGFNISWSSGMTLVVESATDLANPIWFPIRTNTLVNNVTYFGDPQWTNHPSRFYRIRWP